VPYLPTLRSCLLMRFDYWPIYLRPILCSIENLECAVAEYISCFNHRGLHGEIGLVPPIEAETTFYASQPVLRSREQD
jgi:hypothetical protein